MQKVLTSHWILGGIIFLISFALYANTIPNEYNLDDELVTKNHRLTSKGISAIPEIFTSNYYEDEMGYSYGYRPIVLVSFALEHEFLGESPHVSHAINVFIYAFTCLLAFFLVRLFKPDAQWWLAFGVALLFTVHPIHTEVVASIKNRDELLALFFALAALIVSLKFIGKHGIFSSTVAIVLIAILFWLSIMSKKSTIFFGLVLPILTLYKQPKKALIWSWVLMAATTMILIFSIDNEPTYKMIYVGLSASILMIYTIFNGGYYKFIGEHIKVHKDLMLFFVSALALILLVGSIHYTLYLLFAAMVTALVAMSLFIESSQKKLLLSTCLVLCALMADYYFGDKRIIILGVIYYLIINQEWISKFKWQMAFVLIILAFYFLLVQKGWEALGLTFLFTLLYLSNLYFKPLMVIAFLAPFIIFGEHVIDVVVGILGVVLIIVYSLKHQTRIHFLTNDFKQKIIIASLIVIMALSVFIVKQEQSYIAQDNLEIVQRPTNIANNLDNIDRPILYMENPIIGNWNIANRFKTYLVVTQFYLKKLSFPYPLAAYYGYNTIEIERFSNTQLLLSGLSILFFVALGLITVKNNHLILLSILAVLLCLMLYSNLLTPVAGIVGERLAYAASFWFCLSVVLLCSLLVKKWSGIRFVGVAVFVIVVTNCSIIVVKRNHLWINKITLFENDVKQVQNSAQANALLGYAYLENLENLTSETNTTSHLQKALVQFNQAIAIYPDYLNWWNDKAKIEESLGQYENAITSYQKAISFDSTYSIEPYLSLAAIFPIGGYYEEAIFYLNEANKIGYDDATYYNSLAVNYVQMSQTEKAIYYLKQGVAKYPNNYDLHLNLGKVYYGRSQNKEALEHFLKAQAIYNSDPNLNTIITELQNSINN